MEVALTLVMELYLPLRSPSEVQILFLLWFLLCPSAFLELGPDCLVSEHLSDVFLFSLRLVSPRCCENGIFLPRMCEPVSDSVWKDLADMPDSLTISLEGDPVCSPVPIYNLDFSNASGDPDVCFACTLDISKC